MIRTPRFSWSRRVSLAVSVLISLSAAPATTVAAAPKIDNLSFRGLQTGAATTVTVEGTDLLPHPRLILPVPTASQVIKQGATAKRVEIEVALPGDVSPGMYQVRLANPKGISNALVIGIDDLAQVPFAPQIASLPAALHGNLAGSSTLRTSFAGKKGQRIVAEVEARRLGAAIDPVVELYDPRRVQLAYSQSHASLDGDARLEAVLPADGTYTIELHDILYRAGSPNQFRLKVGELYYADLVFPLGGQRGTEASFELIGNTPPTIQRVKVDLRAALADMPVALPPTHGLTGIAPRIIVDDFPEVIEADPPQGKLQEVTVPAVINGRISKPREEDRYRLLVKPGVKLRFDVVANRARSPLDGVLVLRNEGGSQLAASDDRPNTIDPGFDYTVPDGVTSLVVALTDLQGRGGRDYLYRLAITPAEQPDFSLAMSEDRQLIPQGGAAVARIRAKRVGYDGPIKLSVPGLPEGVILSGGEIPAGVTDTLLSFSAPPSVKPAQGVTGVVGASNDPKSPLRRRALLPETPVFQSQLWLRSELAIAITEPGPIQIAWESNEASLAIGSSYPAKVKMTRAKGFSGPIRLSLLTSQVVPKTADGKQDDLNRALRIDGTPTIAADQVSGVAPVIVPADLPAIPYDVAVRAELLGADGKAVLATAVTPSRRLGVTQPFALQLVGPAGVEAKSGSGSTGKFTGKVVRAGGFTKPVTVTLSGLPAGIPAPAVTLPDDQSDFELPVAFPYETKLGPLPNVKLVATSQVSPQRVIKSNEIPVNIQIVKGDPPPLHKPFAIFEDQPDFIANLNQGAGTATLETSDKYSGKSSVKVTPDQRFNDKLPGLGIRIRQNPGSGEYRFLRFAWKKKGGQTICLQLNHDGQWGPTGGKPAKFRYHAGPGPECYGASVAVDNKIPADWVVVTRDLYADFGEFTLTGIALSPVDGEFALFDHVYLGKTTRDFESVKPQPSLREK